MIAALLHFLGGLPTAAFAAVRWAGGLLVGFLVGVIELAMPILLAGAALSGLLVLTHIPVVQAAPVWGGLAVGVTTTAVLAGILLWAWRAHGWWSR